MRRWGRRTRRLRNTVLVLTALVAGTALALFLAHRASRPETRKPGEELPDITRKLARNLPPEAPMPVFTDVTQEAGLGSFSSFAGERTSQLPEDMGPGAAWGDFDADGDDDLFLVSSGGALDLPIHERSPSQLYENLGDGSFRRVESCPDIRILGMAAAWGDYDGDGRLDLAVTGYESLLLFRNTVGGFERASALPAPSGYWAGATWGDFDNDRDLDLYVTGYVRYTSYKDGKDRLSEQYGAAVPYTLNPASYPPERNLLFRNEGDASFTEVAAELGVANPEGRSLGALWHDFNADGRLDLYVANDISDNVLFLNRGDHFEDVSLAAWVADYRGAMGLAAGDWNRDGDDDLFVTHWVAQENALYDSLLSDLQRNERAPLRKPPGQPDRPPLEIGFSDRAAPLGLGQIALRFVGWGTEFADFDADGWLDLVIANGSTFETQEEAKHLKPQPALLMWNQGGRFFHDLAPLDEDLSTPRVGRGLAVSDYDLDGDLDLLLVDRGEGVRLLRNDMQTGHWIGLKLKSVGPGGELTGLGEGATVIVTADGVDHRRSVTGSSYLSQSSRALHFGLGDASEIQRVEVRWLGGKPQEILGLDIDAHWEIHEGDPVARRAKTAIPPKRLAPRNPAGERERIAEFWAMQRAAMEAIKRRGDTAGAIPLFRRALDLDPEHRDSRYYLANCLAIEGRTEDALEELATLRRQAPQSHRAHKQWGVLRALAAQTDADLNAAGSALERALELNPEETGALLVLGEIALLQGDAALARQRFELACRTNPQAVGGFFLRAYLAWKKGGTLENQESRNLLAAARKARGEEWKPKGAVAEGDVETQMHREETPLSRFWEGWDGAAEPARAFGPLKAFLESR